MPKNENQTPASKSPGFFARLVRALTARPERRAAADFAHDTEKKRSVTCYIWEEKEGNWGHASLGGEDFYLSLWPRMGAGLYRKEGKVMPARAMLLTFEMDRFSEAGVDSEIPKEPDYVIKIDLNPSDYQEILNQIEKIKRGVKDGTVQYCAANCNLPLYGERGVEAYNCTGVVQHVLSRTQLDFDRNLVVKPSEFARELRIALDPKASEQRREGRRMEDQYEKAIHYSYY